MRVAIIRGPNLNPFEMQSYLPLTKEHELVAFATAGAPFCENGAAMKVHRLPSPARFVEKAPARLRRFTHHLLSRSLGPARNWLLGLEGKLQGMDILHTAETGNGYSFQALLAKRKWGSRLIVTVWENIPFNFETHPFARYVKAKVRGEADHFIAVTDQARDCLQREGVDASRIGVISAGIDVGHFRPGRSDPVLCVRLGLKPDRPTVLFVGRLVPEKGVQDLLLAFHYLRFHHRLAANLLVIGEGRELFRLIQRARSLGLEEIAHFHPPFSYQVMPEIYRLGDVLVLPSRPTKVWQEQFGMVLVEAMACGLPVVATDTGAIPEVVGEAGIIVPPDSPVRLAEAIARVLSNPELSRHLRAVALHRARENFSHLLASRRIGEAYEKVIESRAKSSALRTCIEKA